MPRLLQAAGAAALLTLAACQHLARLPVVDVVLPTAAVPLPPVAPVVPDPPPQRTGAIFQADRYRPLFEAHRARIVGDTLTVNIIEKVSAVQKSTSSLDRSGTADSSVSALPGRLPCWHSRAASTWPACRWSMWCCPPLRCRCPPRPRWYPTRHRRAPAPSSRPSCTGHFLRPTGPASSATH